MCGVLASYVQYTRNSSNTVSYHIAPKPPATLRFFSFLVWSLTMQQRMVLTSDLVNITWEPEQPFTILVRFDFFFYIQILINYQVYRQDAVNLRSALKSLSLTSVLEQPICEKGQGPCIPSQSPRMGFWWSVSWKVRSKTLKSRVTVTTSLLSQIAPWTNFNPLQNSWQTIAVFKFNRWKVPREAMKVQILQISELQW